MSENKQKMTPGEQLKEIIKAIMSDADFKKALENNLKEALSQISILSPEDVDAKVVESAKPTSKVAYLVLPISLDELTKEPAISQHDRSCPPPPLTVCLYCPFH